MLNVVKKIVDNPLICYLPTIFTVTIVVTYLLRMSTFLCFFNTISEQCLFENNTNIILNHPIIAMIVLLLAYTCFYLHYSISLGNNLVARAVESIYVSVSNTLKIERESKQILLWLICYLSTLLFSYLILPVLVVRNRVLNK